MKVVVENFASLKREVERMCETLAVSVPESAVFSSKLVASELLTNALLHGSGRAQLSYLFEGGEIRINVYEEGGVRPPDGSVCSDVYAESGRGLFLVDALSDGRTFSETEGVCVVIKIRPPQSQ